MALYFNRPLPKTIATSEFGWRKIKVGDMVVPVWQRHLGQDLRASIGTPGRVAYLGHISKVWTSLRAGLCFEITHTSCSLPGFLVQSVYYHLHKLFYRYLQQVSAEEVVYETGNSGTWTSGPHLHWGVKVNGIWIDPRLVIKELNNVKRVIN